MSGAVGPEAFDSPFATDDLRPPGRSSLRKNEQASAIFGGAFSIGYGLFYTGSDVSAEWASPVPEPSSERRQLYASQSWPPAVTTLMCAQL